MSSTRSGKGTKQRAATNTTEMAGMSTNEKILKECHDLYIDEKNGLIALGQEVGLSLLPPRKKITVLLLGNHSAGKSSFINWYIEEHVQKTAVAIETQGFALITSGKKRESLTGNATLHLFPQFRQLEDMEGVVDYLTTEVSTSKQKKFPFVIFIDTPGLVDGDMKYPFDVDKTLIWLGGIADLILVFFDPLGQALCKRTLDIVERLNERHPDRIRFYLSKADTAGTQGDRQRVLMQITQELCKRPGLNRAGFDMPTIFIPTITEKAQCENHLEDVCSEVEKTINRNIQNTLNTLEKDAQSIASRFHKKMEEDKNKSQANKQVRWKAIIFYLISIALPLIYSVILAGDWTSGRKKKNSSNHSIILAIVLLIAVVTFLIGYRIHRIKPTLNRKDRNSMKEKIAYIDDLVKNRKSVLYQEYLSQSVAALDLF